jgi:MtrB/PioB family decaheme-associated outer membrane protein
MKATEIGRSRRDVARRILRVTLSALVMAAGASAQEGGSPEVEEKGGRDEAKRRELVTLSSEVESGFFWNANDSNAFGDFTGLANDGFYVLGNADVRHRTAWDDPNPMYLRLRGLNLGLDSREALAEWKQPGRYGAFFTFDQIPKYWNEEGSTFFFKQGDSLFTLPPACPGGVPAPGCWVAGQNTAGMTSLNSNLRDVDSRYMRETFGGGISTVLPEHLDFSAAYEHQEQWGRYWTGATMGLTGGNPRSVTLPERVDQTTQNWETALRYAVEALQLDLEYYGSYYNNHEDSVTWEDPYLANAAWNPNAGYPPSTPCWNAGNPTPGCGLGRKDQAPDNWFNQIIASGGYELPWKTRIVGNTAFGWMTQDESFLPYTVNSSLVVTTPVPRNDLDGRIDTRLVNFQIASRPIEKVRLDLRYRFDQRKNQTPRDVYIYIRNDSEDQGTIDGEEARVNRPYSFKQQHVDFEAGYELFERTELTLGYDWTQTKRDFQEAKRVWENGLGAELWSRPWSWFTARTHYRHAWRNNSGYDGLEPQYAGWSSQFLATFDPTTEFENHPLLRKFYLAKAQRDELGSLFTVTPIETVGVGINVNWYHDDFDDTEIGLTDREIIAAGIDVSWSPVERVTTNAFYNYEHFTSDQDGWSFNTTPGTATNPARRWEGKDKDRAHTVGVGYHVDLIPERLGLDAQYLFSWVRGTIGVDLAPGFPPPTTDFPYPNERTRIHDVSVRLNYQVTEQIGMRVGYLFERMSTRDWALDGVQPGVNPGLPPPAPLNCTAGACAIASGQGSAEATSHLVSWSVYYDFFW